MQLDPRVSKCHPCAPQWLALRGSNPCTMLQTKPQGETKQMDSGYRKIGMVGGVAWASTLTYYRLICQWSQQRHQEFGRAGTPDMP